MRDDLVRARRSTSRPRAPPGRCAVSIGAVPSRRLPSMNWTRAVIRRRRRPWRAARRGRPRPRRASPASGSSRSAVPVVEPSVPGSSRQGSWTRSKSPAPPNIATIECVPGASVALSSGRVRVRVDLGGAEEPELRARERHRAAAGRRDDRGSEQDRVAGNDVVCPADRLVEVGIAAATTDGESA